MSRLHAPVLLSPWTLPGKTFYLARAICLFVLLVLAVVSAQILGLVPEGGDAPAMVIVLVALSAAGMAHILVSLACLATRRLPSLALIWGVDLLLSGGLLTLVVLLGVEVTGASCDVGGALFEVDKGHKLCDKLVVAWVLAMTGAALFVVSGVTAGVASCTQAQGGDDEGGHDMGWGIEGWRLEDVAARGGGGGWTLHDIERQGGRGGYPVGTWAGEVSEATNGAEDGGLGYTNRVPSPSRGHGDAHRPQEPPSIGPTLSRTFEHANNRRSNAAQPSAQPSTFPTQAHRPRGLCLTNRATQPEPEAEGSSSDSAARSPGAVLRAREAARRTLEGEVDGLPVGGVGAEDKKSTPSRAAKAPAAADRESWESWETDRRCTSSGDESAAVKGVAVGRGTGSVRTPERQPASLQGTGAPARPRLRRMERGVRVGGGLGRPAFPDLFGMQTKRVSGSSGAVE